MNDVVGPYFQTAMGLSCPMLPIEITINMLDYNSTPQVENIVK
jgi:hypothetical protein